MSLLRAGNPKANRSAIEPVANADFIHRKHQARQRRVVPSDIRPIGLAQPCHGKYFAVHFRFLRKQDMIEAENGAFRIMAKTVKRKPSKRKSAGTSRSSKAPAASRSKTASTDPVFARGLDVRRAMWGHDGAEGQIDAASDFIWPMQDYVTRHCFGETWTRTRLPRKTRSMITLGILVSQGRPHELKVHVRGALANGVSKDEIQEVLLHAMVYSGIPRGVEGFRSAAEVLKELGLE